MSFSTSFVSRPGLDYVDLSLGVLVGALLSQPAVRNTLWVWALSKVAVAAYVSLGLTLLSLFGSWYAEHSQFVLKR